MTVTTTAERLKKIMADRGLKQVDVLNACQPYCKKFGVKLAKNDLSQYVSGKAKPRQDKLTILGHALNVSEVWLMGYDVPMQRNPDNFKAPIISTKTVSFPVLGSIAAGYNEIAVENWSGETVEVPEAYLKGRKKEEYFVLSVKGDSMYPLYMNGDKVLILRQSTLNHSGEIGAVLYEGENATLKKVEYIEGENWIKLIPINPEYMPKLIENSDLEQCRILGIPRLLIREM